MHLNPRRRWRTRSEITGSLALIFVLAATPAVAMPLRILSFNLRHGGVTSERTTDDEHLEARIALTIPEIEALAPDVIGMQEASMGRRRGNIAARFAEALGMHWVRASAGGDVAGRVVRLALGFEEGPAILSRFPVVESRHQLLEDCGPWWRRVLLCATIDTPGGLVDICSVHADGSDCQLRSLARILDDRRTDRLLVVTGDMNAIESTEGMRALLAATGLRDTFREAHPDDPGLTCYQPVADPERRAHKRIDYILVRPAQGTTLEVVESRVVLDEPRRPESGLALWPSDHYGVFTLIGP
jgi:endonuclease/exonuclease/phosphatase family metal-dependent hydrolase